MNEVSNEGDIIEENDVLGGRFTSIGGESLL